MRLGIGIMKYKKKLWLKQIIFKNLRHKKREAQKWRILGIFNLLSAILTWWIWRWCWVHWSLWSGSAVLKLRVKSRSVKHAVTGVRAVEKKLIQNQIAVACFSIIIVFTIEMKKNLLRWNLWTRIWQCEPFWIFNHKWLKIFSHVESQNISKG